LPPLSCPLPAAGLDGFFAPMLKPGVGTDKGTAAGSGADEAASKGLSTKTAVRESSGVGKDIEMEAEPGVGNEAAAGVGPAVVPAKNR